MLKAESEVLFERRAVLSQKVLDHGRALMTPLLEQIKDGGRNDPHKAQFKKPIDMFELAIDLEPENTEAEEELAIADYNASIGAAQARESAVQSRMSSQLNQMYGRAARRAGVINAGSSLLAGASNIGYIRATA